MVLLREWFFGGVNYLLFAGLALILVSALLPWNKRRNKRNLRLIIVLAVLYVVCELIVTFWTKNWMLLLSGMLVGGVALSATIGRLIRLLFICVRNSIRRSKKNEENPDNR